MKKFITRAAVVILIGGMSVAIGGCYGPFRLTSKLHHWNGQVSQKKFVNELVFLGMCIIPAYEICILGDGLIFNSIEWWGGRNPISMKDGQQEEVKFAYEGQEYKVTKTKDQIPCKQRPESRFQVFSGRKILVSDEWRKQSKSG